MINQIRYHQQTTQAQAVRSLSRQPQVVIYKGRDPQTGQRLVGTVEGGVARADYLSPNEPQANPVIINPGAIGVIGNITNR